MIVLSVVLVVVAAVLLIAGIVAKGVLVIYLSIGASVLAALLLFLGVRAARPAAGGAGDGRAPEPDSPGGGPGERPAGEAGPQDLPGSSQPAPAATGAPDGADAGTRSAAAPASAAPAEQHGEVAEGTVMVVSGRPRYHRPGCRFLAGRGDAEPLPLAEAREVGFTSCPVCRPDEPEPAAGPAEAAQPTGIAPGSEPASVEPAASDPAAVEPAASDPAAVEPAASDPVGGERAVEPAGDEPAADPRSGRGAAGQVPPGTGPGQASTRWEPAGPGSGTVPDAPGTGTVPDATTGAQAPVVLIPDRGRFHRPDCRFVRNMPGLVTASRGQAEQQGYSACAVCRP